MSLAILASKLRELAEQVEDVQGTLSLPEQRYTLADAFTRLRAAHPDKYTSIRMELHWHVSTKAPELEWTVYDGTTHHEAGTLADAINAAVLAAKPKSNSVDALQVAAAILDTATERPF